MKRLNLPFATAILAASDRKRPLSEGLAPAFPDGLYAEMGPGNVLVGLVKKIAPSVQTMTCGSATEVEQLLSRAA